MKNMPSMDALGLRESWVYESLLATADQNGVVNVAAMGFKRKGKNILLWVYPGCDTYDNLMRTKRAVINLVSDIGLFFEPKKLEGARKMSLKEADCCVELIVDNMEKGQPAVFLCSVKGVKGKPKKLLNRAEHLLLEALIDYTKIGYDEYAVDRLRHYSRVANKVAPGSKAAEMIDSLLKDVVDKRGKYG